MARMVHTVGELQAQHLTGKVRGRAGWFGRIVMQVEVKSPKPRYPKPPPPRGATRDVWSEGAYTYWRDARLEDLAEINCA